MTPVQAIFLKELRSAFVSPIVYVVSGVFLASFGILSYTLVQVAGALSLQQMQVQGAAAHLNLNELVLRPAFYWTGVFLLIVVLPILTMRSLAEERKLRTFELLATSPISINEIVIGKFMSVYAIFLGLLGLTSIGPLILSLFSSFNWNPVFSGYLGLALLGALYIATGILASALTENQIVAVLLSFGFLVSLWFVGFIGAYFGDTAIGSFLSYLSFSEHIQRLLLGLIDTKDLVYFGSGVVLMLFLAHRVMESHRWK